MNIDLPSADMYYQFVNWDSASRNVPILFLHSALSTHREFGTLSAFFEDRRQIFVDFPSHGQSSMPKTQLSMSALAGVMRDLLEKLELFHVDIIGYSMGGYAAIELARIAPGMVRSITSHAMKFYWTEEAMAEALEGLGEEKIRKRSEKAYQLLSELHAKNGLAAAVSGMKSIIGDFKDSRLSEADLRSLHVPLLLSAGDRDDLVPLGEIVRLFQSQNPTEVSLAIHPNSPHALSKLDLISFTHSIREFWKLIPEQ